MTSKHFIDPHCIPECDTYSVDGTGSSKNFQNCDKNPRHENIIPVDKFKMEDLPPESQNSEVMKVLQLACDFTVKISTTVTSRDRPDTYPNSNEVYPHSNIKGSRRFVRCGTGLLLPPSLSNILDTSECVKQCPCHICRKSDHPEEKYCKVIVVTSTHVIFNDEEASQAVIECFFDSDDKKDVKCLYGIDVILTESQKCHTDLVLVNTVTHDFELVEKLIDLNNRDDSFNPPTKATVPRGYVISHPHGMSKRISFGNILYNKIPVDSTYPPGKPNTFGPGAKYRRPLAGNIIDLIEPTNTTFTLPRDSKYFCTFKEPWKCLVSKWVTFPEGTKFTLPNGKDACFPSDAEFSWDDLDIYTTFHSYHYLVYDVPTCPGSSGAPIIHHGGDWIYTYAPHAGVDKEDGKNRSSFNLLPDIEMHCSDTNGNETQTNDNRSHHSEVTGEGALYHPELETQDILRIKDCILKNIRKMDVFGNVCIELVTNMKSAHAESDYSLLNENNKGLDEINQLLSQVDTSVDEGNTSQGAMNVTTGLSLLCLINEIYIIFFIKLKLAVEWMIYLKNPAISNHDEAASSGNIKTPDDRDKVKKMASMSLDTLKILLDKTEEIIEKLKALLTERKNLGTQWSDLNDEMELFITKTKLIPSDIKKLLSEREASFQILKIVCEENYRFSEIRRLFLERSNNKEQGVKWEYHLVRGKKVALRRKQFLIQPKYYL